PIADKVTLPNRLTCQCAVKGGRPFKIAWGSLVPKGEAAMSESVALEDRAAFANGRLANLRDDLKTKLSKIEQESAEPELCIYVTGSLARGEASEHSDLDAFFLLSESQDNRPLGRIREVKILNAVVQSASDAKF